MLAGRTEELLYLEKIEKKQGLKILFLAGRPGLGKRELMFRFSKNKTAFFFSSEYCSSFDQLKRYKEIAFLQSNTSFFQSKQCHSWEVFFRYIFQKMRKKIRIIVIDDFLILCESSKEICSSLQKVWEELKENENFFLILLGSGYPKAGSKNIPLFKSGINREVFSFELKPIKFEHITSFFPKYSAQQKVFSYSILGGNPTYLQQFDRMKTIEQNVKKEILDKKALLYKEPYLKLLGELREPSNYFSFLQALAIDKIRLKDIAKETGYQNVHFVNKYLYVLRKRKIIKKVFSINDNNHEKSRKGIYQFTDPFFKFWFRFVFPYRNLLKSREISFVWQKKINPYLNDFTQMTFIEICLQRLERYNKYKKLPFQANQIGPWWNNKNSVDILASNEEGEYLLCKCFWKEKKMAIESLRNLEKKAKNFPKAKNIYFGLFSKIGYSPELSAHAKENPRVLLLPYY